MSPHSDAKALPRVRIIPCLDIEDGRIVKGVRFEGLQDAGDPIEAAQRYNSQGADELVLLDISATVQGRDTLYALVEDVARHITIPLTVGGGIRKLEDIQRLLEAGASKVSIGSAAVRDPELVRQAAQAFGGQRLVVAIDARRSTQEGTPQWEVLTHGGRHATGLDAVAWAKQMEDFGAGEVLLTSMDQDGTRAGFDLALTHAVSSALSIPVIASGGVGDLQHLADGVLKGGASGVLAASIFHFGEFTIPQAKRFLQSQGIPTSGEDLTS